MSVNLKGTWLFDTSKNLDLSMFGESGTNFYVDYETDGIDSTGNARSYVGTRIWASINGLSLAWGDAGGTQSVYGSSGWQWYYKNALKIKITGGNDVESSILGAFLESNAVKQSDATFNLSALNLTGTHRITVKARGTGYISSPESEAVEYTV